MAKKSLLAYQIESVYNWACDNGKTPYIVVVVDKQCAVPMAYVNPENKEIVLNMSPMATRGMEFGNDFITFSGRFNGKSEDIKIPYNRVASVFSRECGEGMGFNVTESVVTNSALSDPHHCLPIGEPHRKPKLTVVKGGKE
jgi:stringent starvation protein B